MPNFAALRAAVFPLSTKNLRGADIRPPLSARVNVLANWDIFFCERCSTCSAYESRVVSVHVHRLTGVSSSPVTIPTSGVIALRPILVVRYECGDCSCARDAYHHCQVMMPSSLDCPWSILSLSNLVIPLPCRGTVAEVYHKPFCTYNCFSFVSFARGVSVKESWIPAP